MANAWKIPHKTLPTGLKRFNALKFLRLLADQLSGIRKLPGLELEMLPLTTALLERMYLAILIHWV